SRCRTNQKNRRPLKSRRKSMSQPLATLDAIRALRGKGDKAQHIPKIKRDAFLYLPSTDPAFAQCSSCSSNTNGKCTTINIPIQPHWTCGFYLPGSDSGQKARNYVTAEQAGLQKHAPRCENCF